MDPLHRKLVMNGTEVNVDRTKRILLSNSFHESSSQFLGFRGLPGRRRVGWSASLMMGFFRGLPRRRG